MQSRWDCWRHELGIHGDELRGRVLDKLEKVPDSDKEIMFDRFEVEIKLVPRGVMLISADIHSSLFQFKIKKSENPKGQLLT